MNIQIRQETIHDHPFVFQLVEAAFKNVPVSDHREQYLIERLRASDAFIPELSLVAEAGHEVVGHILLTRISIHNAQRSYTSLALAPVTVQPEYQGQGIGTMLVHAAHDKARNLGFTSVALLGQQTFYGRFGYELAKDHNILFPLEVPEENCFILELMPHGLAGVSGMIRYPKVFFE